MPPFGALDAAADVRLIHAELERGAAQLTGWGKA